MVSYPSPKRQEQTLGALKQIGSWFFYIAFNQVSARRGSIQIAQLIPADIPVS
jgi:hypothetical protein